VSLFNFLTPELEMESPTSPPYVLCLDGGTESIRAGIFDCSGTLLSASSSAYPTRFPKSGWAEQDPAEWWAAAVRAVQDCLAVAPVRAADIRGLSLDATTCTLLALGADMQPLLPAFLWVDVRAASQAERIFAAAHAHPALTYSPAGCNAEWMVCKALWLDENEPELYARTTHFIEYTDWLVYQLTGKLVLNLNTATQRWYYNDRTWKFPSSLYDLLGFPDLITKIPQEVIPAGQAIGTLRPDVARTLGLSETTIVYQGGGDAFIGLLGLNVTRPGKIGLITGSSNVLAGFTAEEFHSPSLYGAFPDAVVPGLFLVEGGQSSTGANLAWFKRTFAQDLPEDLAYQILDGEAISVLPGAGGLVGLDYFQGNRTPYTDSQARGALWGLSLSSSRGQVFRALMESIAFGSRLILESLAVNGCPVEQIFACGGATYSDLFMQIYADICGIPISVVKVADAPLVGDAVLAFTGLGVYADLAAAAEAMVKFDRHYLPNLELSQEYQFYFELYKDTYHQLKGLMHRLSKHLREPEGDQPTLRRFS
jgi:ribulokinase